MKPWKLKRTRRFKNKGEMLFDLMGIRISDRLSLNVSFYDLAK